MPRLDWSGDFSLAPLASKGRFKFANLDATKHWGYVRESAGFDVTSGTLGFDGDYDFRAGIAARSSPSSCASSASTSSASAASAKTPTPRASRA